MKSELHSLRTCSPKDISDALEILKTEPGQWMPLAGGTDLMVLLNAGKLFATHFMNLWNISELKEIHTNDDSIQLGALTTFSQLRSNKIIRNEFPVLFSISNQIGAWAIQNRATIGGNIANASPAADSSPGFLVYDAELELISQRGSRKIAYQDFHLGYKKTALKPDELIKSISLPRKKWNPSDRHYFRKIGTRQAQAISKICFAGLLRHENTAIKDIRIAIGSVAPTPLRCVETEKFLKGNAHDPMLLQNAKKILSKEIKPINDIRSTGKYRFNLAKNLLEEFLEC